MKKNISKFVIIHINKKKALSFHTYSTKKEAMWHINFNLEVDERYEIQGITYQLIKLTIKTN